MQSFREIIDRWPEPSPVTFAQDIGEEAGTCRQWRNRNTLPPRVWNKTVSAAEQRNIDGVTLEVLAILAERGRAAAATSAAGREGASAS